MTDPDQTPPHGTNRRKLRLAIEHAAHVLPAQGPIHVFIHHNTLHAFEQLPFERAVVQAGELFGCEPFLSEARYREEIASGRIAERDVRAVLEHELGGRGSHPICAFVTRGELWHRLAWYGLREARGEALSFMLSESEALERYRHDLPADAREVTAAARPNEGGEDDERGALKELFQACRRAVRRAAAAPACAPGAAQRHRDLLLATTGVDIDDWIQPVLVRFLGAYLDQGIGQAAMGARQVGLHARFVALYGRRLSRWCGRWARGLPALLAAERDQNRGAVTSIQRSLEVLGVAEGEWSVFLTATALALRGWAGMVQQIEARPDRVPALDVPARFTEFLAVRLLLERAALTHAAEAHTEFRGTLAQLRPFLAARLPARAPASETERAFGIFEAAQLCGLPASTIGQLSARDVEALESELSSFNGLERRRVLQLAYERHLRQRAYDALAQPAPAEPCEVPAFQAMFCLDDREESLRRHLEEVEPRAETFGVAGFFGVAMYYRGATDARPRPLCPVALRPSVYVSETHDGAADEWPLFGAVRRRVHARLDQTVYRGSRSLFRGALVMTLLGMFSLIPLVLRVLFPRAAAKLPAQPGMAPQRGRLELERSDAEPAAGSRAGFTLDEMADIVRATLETAGMSSLAPLVFVFGHASSSVNNPHASAYDCGACGGGRGGPNARAFAAMANHPEVRARLSARGFMIPEGTWFVGGQHDTTDDALVMFEDEALPGELASAFERARQALDAASARNAHERCRRFPDAARLGIEAARRHVQTRALDLAQPRPEYNHATNAFCIVGRRARTRGLFLDRRAFLVSYDASKDDPQGQLLAGLLEAIVPVVVGINLEYFFSTIDNRGYGCGSKLPHNVASLLGVMDGQQSDLRTGLWAQTVEIHEPVRLSLVIESQPEVVSRVLRESQSIAALVHNRWFFVACLDPASQRIWEWREGSFVLHEPEATVPVIEGGSMAWYRGKHGHLMPGRIQARSGAPA